MSTQFSNPESARDYGISMAGVDPKKIEITEDKTLKVSSAAGFLSDETTPEGREQKEKDLAGQKGYRFKNKDGIELGVVVAPFRDGFCVWGVSLDTGFAMRF